MAQPPDQPGHPRAVPGGPAAFATCLEDPRDVFQGMVTRHNIRLD